MTPSPDLIEDNIEYIQNNQLKKSKKTAHKQSKFTNFLFSKKKSASKADLANLSKSFTAINITNNNGNLVKKTADNSIGFKLFGNFFRRASTKNNSDKMNDEQHLNK